MTFTNAALTSARPTDRPCKPTPGPRVRSGRRPTVDVVANVGLLGLLWFAYAAVRNLPGDTRLAASANAVRLLGLESALRVDVEAALQSTIDWPQALVAANPTTCCISRSLWSSWRWRSVVAGPRSSRP